MYLSKIITLAVAVIAIAMLAACASTTTGSNQPANTALSCAQQYHAWKYGPARSAGKHIDKLLHRVQAAASVQDIEAARQALQALGPAVTALQAHPIPRCADPAGYWHKLLARLKAGADNAGSASGFTGLLLAVAPLKALKPLEAKLSAELKRTVQG
jgi:hypothetical protein